MKKINLILAVMTIFFYSCTDDNVITGEGPIVTEEISLADFSAIESNGSFNVTVSKGANQKVEVTGHANIIDRLERTVNNQLWRIDLEDGNYRNLELSINIVIPELNRALLVGSGDIIVNDFTSIKDVFVGIYGSGDIDLYANEGCENLTMEIEGSGEIKTYGQFADLDKIDLDIVGSGGYDGFSLNAVECMVRIEGSGKANVFANTTLDVVIEGSGTVHYKGDPAVNSNIQGSGQVIESN